MKKLLSLSLITTIVLYTVSCASRKNIVPDNALNAGINPPAIDCLNDNLDEEQKALIEEALTWIGTPYKYADATKGVGTDCSGMTMMVFLTALDVKIPRNSAKQAEESHNVDKKHLKPGDLVFFATGKDTNKVSHVGLMITDSTFIHSSTKKGVTISDLHSPYYTRTFICGGRIRKKQSISKQM